MSDAVGVLTIYPTDIKAKDVFEWGGFKITVAIPVGKTFEEMYEFIEYSSFDKRSRVLLIPGEEFEKYWSGKDKKSLLTSATKTARFYDEIPVRVVPAITIDSEGPN